MKKTKLIHSLSLDSVDLIRILKKAKIPVEGTITEVCVASKGKVVRLPVKSGCLFEITFG